MTSKISYKRKDIVYNIEPKHWSRDTPIRDGTGVLERLWAGYTSDPVLSCKAIADERCYGFSLHSTKCALIARAGGLDKW